MELEIDGVERPLLAPVFDAQAAQFAAMQNFMTQAAARAAHQVWADATQHMAQVWAAQQAAQQAAQDAALAAQQAADRATRTLREAAAQEADAEAMGSCNRRAILG